MNKSEMRADHRKSLNRLGCGLQALGVMSYRELEGGNDRCYEYRTLNPWHPISYLYVVAQLVVELGVGICTAVMETVPSTLKMFTWNRRTVREYNF